jgi:hypothetical protein
VTSRLGTGNSRTFFYSVYCTFKHIYLTAKKLVLDRLMLFCNSAAFYHMIDSFFETLAIIVCISFETIKGTVYSTGLVVLKK